jgi:beta-galactosidase
MNGANSDESDYEPDVTSYDYDAPLDESGRPTAKYLALREVIAKATGTMPPAVPTVAPIREIPEFTLDEGVSLWDVLSAPMFSEQVLSMEDLDQAYGYILYRHELKGAANGHVLYREQLKGTALELEDLHDYAHIYLDGELVGALDRRLGQKQLKLKVPSGGERLDILVENSGRVNYGLVLRQERKGITKEVTLAGQPLLGWDIYSLPMTEPAKLHFTHTPCVGPCFYRGFFYVDRAADTFLDTSEFSKGQVWLNGRALGRVWSIGPQETLYVPGPWLHEGENEVIVFDLDGKPGRSLAGRDSPILNATSLHNPKHRITRSLTVGPIGPPTLVESFSSTQRGKKKLERSSGNASKK